jgi:hypothetical protein
MPVVRVQQSFYPSGQIESEVTLVGGLPNGFTRFWHPNGVLAQELAVKDGRPEGISRHWNEKGEEVGSFEIRNGTGVMKTWHPNGTLQGELTYVDGEWTGRQRVWFEDGEFAAQVFWLRGRKVSRKKYLEACKADPTLPNYENEPKVKSWETKMKKLAQRKGSTPAHPESTTATDCLLEEFLNDPTKREARGWLMEAVESETRTLGEIPSWRESLALVEEAHAEGVEELCVVKVADDGDGLQNTGILLARLPAKGRKRKTALAWCNEQNGFQGFDPEDDRGQDWISVQLD